MFLHKVPHLLKTQISMSKSTASLGFIRKLKKSTVVGGKELKLPMIRHYDYRFLQEYQFSPSTRNAAPLLRYRSIKRRATAASAAGPAAEKKKWSCRDLCPTLLSACLRPQFPEGGARGEQSPSPGIAVVAGDHQLLMLERSGCDVCCDSVDQRAERFIEKFYEEMRRQPRESIFVG